MNHRILLHRLTIAAAIGMLVAAVAYRAEAPSRRVATPPAVESQLEIRTIKNNEQLQQQRRLTRLQSRF